MRICPPPQGWPPWGERQSQFTVDVNGRYLCAEVIASRFCPGKQLDRWLLDNDCGIPAGGTARDEPANGTTVPGLDGWPAA